MSTPPSKVIHARIDLESLVSVCDFYSQQGGPETDPLSTRVALTLATLMTHLRESGQLPSHPPSSLEIKLHEYLSKPALNRSVNLSGLRPGLVEPSELEGAQQKGSRQEEKIHRHVENYSGGAEGLKATLTQAPIDDPRQALRDLIDSSLTAVTQPTPELDPDIWAPDPSDLPDPGNFQLDIDKQPKLAVTDLPPGREEVLTALASASRVDLMLCQIIFALDKDIPAEHFKQLASQLRPHVEEYFSDEQ